MSRCTNITNYHDVKVQVYTSFIHFSRNKDQVSGLIEQRSYSIGKTNLINEANKNGQVVELRNKTYCCINLKNNKLILCLLKQNDTSIDTHYGITMTISQFIDADAGLLLDSTELVNTEVTFNDEF